MKTRTSFDSYPPEVLREISRAGGIASGAARRRKRDDIEREILRDAAMRKMRVENVRMIAAAARLLKEAERRR